MEHLEMTLLPKDGVALLAALESGAMVVVKSKQDFMYVILRNDEYHMFMHTVGAPNGGSKRFTADEKYTAVVKNFAELSDLLVSVAFDDKTMNIYNVMASAEEAILDEFPDGSGEPDAIVDFTPPNANDNVT